MWTESVYLDAVAPDGQSGFVARLQRAPEVENAWLWVHAFDSGDAWSFNDDRVACDSSRTDVEGADVHYATADGSAQFDRAGPREAMTAASVRASVGAHKGLTAPLGPGPMRLDLRASFTPTRAVARGTLPGRTEEHGTVEVAARWDGGGFELTALGQWHEQHQELPRFGRPFTYLTFRGPDAAVVAVVGTHASGGWARRGDTVVALTAVRIDAPGSTRVLEGQAEDGSLVTASLTTTHAYEVPIGGRPRPGTFVTGTLAGAQVSGCVNHWEPGPFEESGIPY